MKKKKNIKQFLYTLYFNIRTFNNYILNFFNNSFSHCFLHLMVAQGTNMQFMRFARKTVFETEPKYSSVV